MSQAELDRIIQKQAPAMVPLTKAVIAKLRPRFPGACELVYDKPRGMVVGFCADETASSAINSFAVYSKWINLFFFALKRARPKLNPKAKRKVLIKQRRRT